MKLLNGIPYFFIICLFFSFDNQTHVNNNADAIIEMTNASKFVPSEITISTGDVVLWQNTSDLVHTVTCDPGEVINAKNVNLPEGAQPFNSGRMKPGTEFKHKFTKPGTYIYFCIPHEMTGMVGKVKVN